MSSGPVGTHPERARPAAQNLKMNRSFVLCIVNWRQVGPLQVCVQPQVREHVREWKAADGTKQTTHRLRGPIRRTAGITKWRQG